MGGQTMRAYATRLRSKWPFLAFSFGFTVLAVVNSARSASEQFVLPSWAWGLIALGCLNVAQFLAWRDLWVDDVDPDHGDKLRAIAGRLREQLQGARVPTYTDEALAAWAAEHMFQAHFPAIARVVASYGHELATTEQARGTLIQKVFNGGAFERFGQVSGWSWGGVAKRCETHLKEIIEGKELDITTNGHGAVVWTTTIVFNGYGLADPVGAAGDAAMQLKEWVTAIRHSPEADAYRKASNARPAFSLAALHFSRSCDPRTENQEGPSMSNLLPTAGAVMLGLQRRGRCVFCGWEGTMTQTAATA